MAMLRVCGVIIMTTFSHPLLSKRACAFLVTFCYYICCCCWCCCNALLLRQFPWSHAPPPSPTRMLNFPSKQRRSGKMARTRTGCLFSLADGINNENGIGGESTQSQHQIIIHEIGVGIDLGTTNSAVAMMISCSDEENG